MSDLDAVERKMRGFHPWSPSQLAHALGIRINLRGHGCGSRSAYFERGGKATIMGHTQACLALSRLAHWKGIDPRNMPTDAPRALIDGKEQTNG